MKNIVLLFLFFVLIVKPAFSEETDNTPEHTDKPWYASVSYATAIWSSDYWNESYPSTPDAVISHQNQKFKDFSNYSIGFGYRSNRFQTDLVYEDFSKIRWTAGETVDNSARTFQNGELHVESKNIMAQFSYDFLRYENNQFFGLVGLGVSEHMIDTAYLMISGTRVDYASPHTTNNTSYRFGIGNRYRLSENTAVETKLTYSDYGKAYNLNSTNNKLSYSIKMQAVEAGVSLKYYF